VRAGFADSEDSTKGSKWRVSTARARNRGCRWRYRTWRRTLEFRMQLGSRQEGQRRRGSTARANGGGPRRRGPRRRKRSEGFDGGGSEASAARFCSPNHFLGISPPLAAVVKPRPSRQVGPHTTSVISNHRSLRQKTSRRLHAF
jgi:hypothetical protein